MEKLDYIVWQPAEGLIDRLANIAADVVALTVNLADTADDVPEPALLLGRGPDAAAIVSVWLDSLDDRALVENAIGAPCDGYLVTESVPQKRTGRDWTDGDVTPGIMHCTWFPKPDRLSDEDFYRGWHDVHSPASFRLHPLRAEYVRDAVARVLTPGSPPIRAVVFEWFRAVEDYADPERLYGPPETLEETMRDLPLYADFDTLSSCPMHETILKSPR
jgi:hypothetical protein